MGIVEYGVPRQISNRAKKLMSESWRSHMAHTYDLCQQRRFIFRRIFRLNNMEGVSHAVIRMCISHGICAPYEDAGP